MRRRRFLRLAMSSAAFAVADRAHAQSRERITLLIGSAPPDPSVHYYYYAKMNGFYEQEGIDIEFKNFTAETTALRALLAREGEVAWTGAISTFQAIDSGAKVKCVSAITSKVDWLIIANKAIADMKQVAGKSFAVSQIGAASQIAPLLMLEAAGVPANAVNWVGLGGSSVRVQALVVKKVDATVLTPAFAMEALKHDYLHQIGDTAKDLSKFMLSLEIANAAAIAAKPRALRGFVTATARGALWGMEHPREAAELSRAILPDAPKDELAAVIELYARTRFWNAAAVLPRESFNFTYGALAKVGHIKSDLTYDEFFFPDFAMAAAERLGVAQPH
jgi:NitT/TauT family transport system substrate-binding protein